MIPRLTEAEVRLFVALGERGRERLREGDLDAAERAFRAQLDIYRPNYDPHLLLGVVAANRGNKKEALEHLKDAVLRGFTDLQRLETAEGWSVLRNDPEFYGLEDAVPRLMEAERAWAGWSSFRAERAPGSAAEVAAGHSQLAARIEAMAPALGPRVVRLWGRLNDRASAALLERYVADRRDATDLGDAVTRLMDLYSGGTTFRWERLSGEDAKRLGAIAGVALERFSEGPTRAGALVCRALSRFAERDGKGRLTPAATEAIRTLLAEAASGHADSPFGTLAVEGQVRTEAEAGRQDRAIAAFRAYAEGTSRDPRAVAALRERLGPLALWAGGLPEFRAASLDGVEVARAALRGKVVVLDFWATWCRQCVEQMSTLRRIAGRHGEKVVLLGVNLDTEDSVATESLKAWVAREAIPGRQLRDGRGWESDLVKAFGVREIPFSVVVGADGTVVAVDARGKALEKAVRDAVE